MRDTPPEFITSLWLQVFFRIRSFCLSLNIRVSESLTIRSFRSEYQSRASDQNIRALSELCFGSEYQSFSLQNIREHSCTCRLKQKQKTYSSISELECLRFSVSVIRYWKYHSCSPPFCQQSKSVGDVLKQWEQKNLSY